LGANPHSIDMVEAGFRTRTTRSVSEMEKYNVKVGDIVKQFGKSAGGTTKNILTRIIAIHPKGTPGFLGTWNKEGWTQDGIKAIERFKDGAAAIEFEVVNQSTEIKPKIDSSKKIEVSKVNYTKNTPNDKSKGFFFTENLQAYLANRGRGAEVRFDLASKDLKLDVTATNNQAGIRRNNGIRNLNAFAIISKKYQQNGSGSFVKEEGQFKDTNEDFELFKKYNTEAIDEAIAYNKPLVIAEAGIATGKSALPLRFAEWLNNELKTKLGIQGIIKENTSTGYKGYGIFNLTQEQPIVEETKEEDTDTFC